jgi:hypothetical protein
MLLRTLPGRVHLAWSPAKIDKLSSGSKWLHEIKLSGHRPQEGRTDEALQPSGNDLLAATR